MRCFELDGFLSNSAVFEGYSESSLFSLASFLNGHGEEGEGGARMLDSH